MSEIDDLRAKLKKRQGRPGFKANVQAIEQQIADIEGGQYRDKETGRFVTLEFAQAHPDSTYRSDN